MASKVDRSPNDLLANLGYRTTIVAGATATRDLPKAAGVGITPAEIIQEGTLAALADRFAVAVPNTAALAD